MILIILLSTLTGLVLHLVGRSRLLTIHNSDQFHQFLAGNPDMRRFYSGDPDSPVTLVYALTQPKGVLVLIAYNLGLSLLAVGLGLALYALLT